MEGLNKFKVLTIVFLCMFVFVIAAIYTNTKDVSENKTQEAQKLQEEQVRDQIASESNNISSDNAQLQELSMRLDNLTQRLDEMNSSSSGKRLNCNIQGVLDENSNIEQLTQDAALQEAQNNGKELVLTCSF